MDVSVPVEVQTAQGRVPREVVLRRAQHRTVQELYAELENARERHQESGELSDEERWARRLMRTLRWMPRLVRVGLVRLLLGSAFRIKARAGTTLVTSVGKFASIPGFAFTFSTGPRAAIFVVGSVTAKP